MHPGCHFHITIFAPFGLAGIERFLDMCLMSFETHTSGFNGRTILRYNGGSEVDFDMQPSLSDELQASGEIFLAPALAFQLMDSLSQVLNLAGFPHWIGLDADAQDRSFEIRCRYPWPGLARVDA